MKVDWFTVIAQIVNFLILVWLLKRFLYQPVLKAIDEREKKVASRLDDAEAKKAEAEKQHDMFQQKNEDFDKERAVKMNEVREEANIEKQRLFEEIRNDSAVLRSKYEDALKRQEQEMIDTLRFKTKDAVFNIAGKALYDLANTELEERIVKVFTEKIRHLDDGTKEKLKNAFDNGKTITIKSAFELSATSKQELEKTIEKSTEKQINFKYLLKPELVSGIEIYTESYRLSWNIESYLDSLKTETTLKE